MSLGPKLARLIAGSAVIVLGAIGIARADSGSPVDDVYGDAFVSHWSPPALPPEVSIAPGKSRRVVVRFIVDEKGKVTSARVLKSPDPRLDAAAVASIKTWTFTPALDAGKPIPTCLDVPVVFYGPGHKRNPRDLQPPGLPETVALTPAEPDFDPPGDYPTILTERKISGAVTFGCKVDASGHVSSPQITGATHVDFVLPGLAALKQWRFKPAHRGDLPVASDVQGQIEFSGMGGSRADVLRANGITAPDGTPPSDPPEPSSVADPVEPYDLLLRGEGGNAAATFTVDGGGEVTDLKIKDSTRPEYAAALAAALVTWHFHPATRDGVGIAVPLLLRQNFPAVPLSGADAADPLARLVLAARAGKITSADGLDGPLTPIFRVSPLYPPQIIGADRVAGAAMVDIVIDRGGRVRLPRIVSASRPEFGWAAATAISQWVFLPPHRGGAAVDVKVRIPFKFAAPDS